MIDFDLALSPAYLLFGAEVSGKTGDGIAFTLTVQDHTAGVQVGFVGSTGHIIDPIASDVSLTMATKRPALSVRAAELVEKELAIDALRDGEITHRGITYRIKGHALAPAPHADGEFFLLLEVI